jgi:NAD(P) transhydrogenase subunit alpha
MSTIIGILREDNTKENRIAVTPALSAKLIKAGFELIVESTDKPTYYSDALFAESEVKSKPRADVLKTADILVSIAPLSTKDIDSTKQNATFFSLFNSRANTDVTDHIKNSGRIAIDLNLLPRQLSFAQSMDAMSSQASIAGYKAVILAAEKFERLIPMMSTAAGTIRPAQVLIMGAGVAGLQAIGTAKRLGAVVTAYDVRPAAAGEIDSLGAKFLDLGLDFSSGQGEGGYARKLTADEQKQQQAAVDAAAEKFDIIITTAQIPGAKPPVLITKAGVENMKFGSVIVDIAASELGGNVEGSKPNAEVVTKNGVKIYGEPNLPSSEYLTASELIARNFADLILHFVPATEDKDAKPAGNIKINLEDELQAAVVIKK